MNDKLTECPQLAECLTGFLDNTMPEAARRSFDLHLKNCSVCRVAVERAHELQSRFQSESYRKPPEDVYRNVLRQIRTENNESFQLRAGLGWSFKIAGALAAAAL